MINEKLNLLYFLLPTEDATQIYIDTKDNSLNYQHNKTDSYAYLKNQHLYLCSTRERNDGDWCFYANSLGGRIVCKAKDTKYGRVYRQEGNDYGHPTGGITPLPDEIFKIEATTDPKLIEGFIESGDGVPEIPKKCLVDKADTFGPYDVETNFLQEYVRRYNLKNKQIDEDKLADEFAKEFLGIEKSVDMTDSDEAYYNPRYKEYIACVVGFLNGQKQQSDNGFSLEDVKKAFTQGKFEGVNMSMVEADQYIQSITEATGEELERMKEYPPFGGPYPKYNVITKKEGLEMYMEMEVYFPEPNGSITDFLSTKRVKLINAQPVIHFS